MRFYCRVAGQERDKLQVRVDNICSIPTVGHRSSRLHHTGSRDRVSSCVSKLVRYIICLSLFFFECLTMYMVYVVSICVRAVLVTVLVRLPQIYSVSAHMLNLMLSFTMCPVHKLTPFSSFIYKTSIPPITRALSQPTSPFPLPSPFPLSPPFPSFPSPSPSLTSLPFPSCREAAPLKPARGLGERCKSNQFYQDCKRWWHSTVKW